MIAGTTTIRTIGASIEIAIAFDDCTRLPHAGGRRNLPATAGARLDVAGPVRLAARVRRGGGARSDTEALAPLARPDGSVTMVNEYRYVIARK
jgi:hypothetical protein